MTSSLRPGKDERWLAAIRQRIAEGVSSCEGQVVIHVSNWLHDLDQARLVPQDHCQLKVYHLDSHRLAHALSAQNKLVPIIRSSILNEMGFKSADNIRLQNLV